MGMGGEDEYDLRFERVKINSHEPLWVYFCLCKRLVNKSERHERIFFEEFWVKGQLFFRIFQNFQ